MFGPNPVFADRRDAGRRLAAALRGYARENPLVLALPRGGVPVGYEVARELGAPLDLVFVRKIGAPAQPELGLGAVVDDGIATGGTVRAVLRALARLGPRRLVLAVPVAPRDSIRSLRAEADEVVCLATPEPFYAVGAHYDDFAQTEDRDVIELLAMARGIARGELSP